MRSNRQWAGTSVGRPLVFVALVAAGVAYGQGQADSTLTGFVVDARSHKPLPDVVVTATSPALQGEQVAVGPLAADMQHRIKFYGSYQFVFTPALGLTLGAAYNGHSGAPISALGGDPLYGGDTVFIIPRGTYGRLPWVHEIDLHLTFDVRLGEDMKLQFGGDCFNVLGSQQMTAVDQSWVYPAATPVAAIPNGTPANLYNLHSPYGAPLSPNVVNSNFGHPTQFQAPRSFRLLARFTF